MRKWLDIEQGTKQRLLPLLLPASSPLGKGARTLRSVVQGNPLRYVLLYNKHHVLYN
jgi:hypothetical protein